MQFGLSNDTLVKLSGIFGKYSQISEVIIYGSRAKGNFTEGSDIDLCIKGESADYGILQKICNDIDELLLPYLFDISVYSSLKDKNLLDHINRAGHTIYQRSKS